MQITALSYNIQYSRTSKYNIAPVAEAIQQSKAQIVAIQEVDRYLERSGSVDQVQSISEVANLPHTHFHKTVEHPKSPNSSHDAEFGIAILSKFPILEVKIHEYSYMKPRNEQRIALAARIDISELIEGENNNLITDLWFINTHIGLDFTFHEQATQVTELTEFLKENEIISHPNVIICGDFNSFNAVCSSISTMKQYFTDVWELYHKQIIKENSINYGKPSKGFGATFPMFFPMIRIDYFWISENIKNNVQELDIEVLNTWASDHRPLKMVIRF